MTKIQYPNKEGKENVFGYTKFGVPPYECHCTETGKSCRSRSVSRKELRCSLLKTLLTIAAASLLGTAVIVVSYRYYQVHVLFLG